MNQISDNIKGIKEIREKTDASLLDSKKAIEESNGNIIKAYEWLFKNTNTFIATEGLTFPVVMQEIKQRLSKLRTANFQATEILKEKEATIKDLTQELIHLENELEKLGINLFNSREWSESQNVTLLNKLKQISTTIVKLSDAETSKINRQEESKKGFWSRVKVAVGDILDPIDGLSKQLRTEYIELAKIIINSNENILKLNELVSEAFVFKVQEFYRMKSSAEEDKNSALSTLNQTKHDIDILKSTAKRNLDLCTNLDEFEECMDGFDVEIGEEIRQQATKLFANKLPESTEASIATLPDEILMVAKGVNGQLELLEDKIRIKRQGILSFMNHGLKGDKEILIERISAIQFKKSSSIFSGYIQFSFTGSQEAKGGLFDAAKDENTVVFTLAEQDKFEKIKQGIEKRMMSKKNIGQQLTTSSNFDDLEKLAALRDKGIITEEEFQTKKRQILGL